MKKKITAVQLQKYLEKSLGGPTKSAAFTGRYVGAQKHPQRKPDEQSRLKFWGHSLPTLRDLAKTATLLSDLSPKQEWDLWEQVYRKSKVSEVRTIAMIWMSNRKMRDLRIQKAQELFALADTVDNWAHSDTLSSMLAELLEHNPKFISIYEKWNKSSNPWLRRQSIVGLYCYARFRKKPLPAKKALSLIEPLLEDPHFYVQRGVGWTLREVDRVDSKLQRKFVRENLHKIGGVAWFATSELYPLALRKELVELRKSERSQKKIKRPRKGVRSNDK